MIEKKNNYFPETSKNAIKQRDKPHVQEPIKKLREFTTSKILKLHHQDSIFTETQFIKCKKTTSSTGKITRSEVRELPSPRLTFLQRKRSYKHEKQRLSGGKYLNYMFSRSLFSFEIY